MAWLEDTQSSAVQDSQFVYCSSSGTVDSWVRDKLEEVFVQRLKIGSVVWRFLCKGC